MKTAFSSNHCHNSVPMYLRCKSSILTGRQCGQDFLQMENYWSWSQKTWYINFRTIILTCAHWQRKISNFCGNANNNDLCSRLVSENCLHYTEPASTQVGTQHQSPTCTCHDLSTNKTITSFMSLTSTNINSKLQNKNRFQSLALSLSQISKPPSLQAYNYKNYWITFSTIYYCGGLKVLSFLRVRQPLRLLS
jgi:hypothetical protein